MRAAAAKASMVNLETVGRPNAGKTGLRLAVSKAMVNSHLASGLYFSGGDPTRVAQMLLNDAALEEHLQEDDIPSSVDETLIEYELHEGDDLRVEFQTHEAVGQILTHTTPDSPPERQRIYRSYIERLSKADVLHIVMPAPPPSPTNADRERFLNDLKITTAYAREALKLRESTQPCGVAIVLTKIDTLYESTESARHELTDEVLKDSLKPLVMTVANSKKVGEAVIVPVSSFGWQKAIRKAEGGRGHDASWILREDSGIEPFNVDTLMVWSLLAGLLHQEVPTQGEEVPDIARVFRMLSEDLHTGDDWIVPIKGRLVV